MDLVCEMIGNAVFSKFALVVGKSIRKALKERERSKNANTSFGGLSRSVLMSRVCSSQNATTELKLRALLRSARLTGWRCNSSLLGKPDFVFSQSKVAVFVDGCFWHGHKCGRNLTPKTNADAWSKKRSLVIGSGI